jgi:hypothetical protein
LAEVTAIMTIISTRNAMERKTGTGDAVTLIGTRIGFGVGIDIRIAHTIGETGVA